MNSSSSSPQSDLKRSTMSINSSRGNQRGKIGWWASSVLPATALVFSLFAMWLWYTETRENPGERPQIDTISEDDMLERANIVFQRANDSVNSAELVLSFLEGASVIITIVIAGAAVVGLSSVNELRDTVDETERELIRRVEEAENRLIAREQQLANMEDLLAEAEARIDRMIDERLARVHEDAETARRQSAALATFSLAEQLLREKNIDAALHACEEAYELDPSNYANNYLYGTLLIEKGDLETAIKRLEEALAIDADFVPAIAAVGLANRRVGDLTDDRHRKNELYNVAEARLLEALQLDPVLLTPDGESYYGTLGSLYRRQGRIEDSLDTYRRAADVTPQRSYPFVNLAMLYLSQSKEQLSDQNLLIAERNAQRKLADTPADYWALFDLALVTMIQNETEKSKLYIKDAIEVTPAVGILYSVMARLEFLGTFNPTLAGLRECSEMIDSQIARLRSR